MKRLILLLIVVFAAGCATQKEWTATGGSRSDGVVRLSYEFGPYEKPVIEMLDGVELAKTRCAAWGYNDAEPFGGTQKVCNMPAGLGGCNQWLVTAEYQCVGDLEK